MKTIHHKGAKTASSISLMVAVIICFIKFAGYYITGSFAILSDALESIINVLAAVLLAFSVRISKEGADDDHHYGHGKIEYFSAGFEGGLIILAGLVILYQAIPKIFTGHILSGVDEGIILITIAAIANLALGLYLIKAGNKYHSYALIADGKHVLTDVYTSAGVFIGLVLVWFTKIPWLDPAVAVLMAIWILVNGWQILATSFHQLMDKADPVILEKVVEAMNESKSPEMIWPHRLRFRESGEHIILDFHLIMPSYLPVDKAHEVEVQFEKRMEKLLNRPADLMIHKDPCIPENCKHCDMNECNKRTTAQKDSLKWTPELLLQDIKHPYSG